MRIVLDLQGAQGEGRFRGIGRYTLALAQAIVRQRGEHEVVLALSDLYPNTVEPIRGLFDGQLPQEQIRVWQAPRPVRSQDPVNDWRRTVARRIREAFIASLEPDIVHVSDLFGGFIDDVVASIGPSDAPYQTTVSLYDLIPPLDSDAYLKPDPRYRRHYLEAVAHAKRADGWLAISESSAREAQDHLHVDGAAVVNISAACDPGFKSLVVSREVEDRLRARYGLARPFLMYSGGSDARKNLDRLIRAYAQLPADLRQVRQLVLVGKMAPSQVDALYSTARAAGLKAGDVQITGYVGDDDLVLLYNLCELFVLPSIHEGFGLPALEAMSCGAAVIGGNLTSLPEVIGWPEALFDPFDVSAMSRKIERALIDEAFRSELIRRGGRQAQRFSWDESARRAIVAFERFHATRAAGVVGAALPAHAMQLLVRDIRVAPGKPSKQDLLQTARAIAENYPETGERRLLVDVSELIRIDLRSGIQRVVRSMLKWLPSQMLGHVEPVYATTDRRGYRHGRRADLLVGASPAMAKDPVVEPRPGDVFLGLDFHPDVVPAQAEFYAELRRLGVRVYFVVYDLLPVLMPGRFPPDAEGRHVRWLQAVCSADGALCISRTVADELRLWIQANPPARHRPFHIGWFHLGADIERPDASHGLPAGAPETLRKLAARPTFLLVGTIEPRKGHAQTLDAFERLWGEETDVNLVFVGKRGWEVEALVARIRLHSELGRRLFWLEGISDEYLDEIYRGVSCLIFPSEGEGFGLPLIEAAQHGTPILARDIPVFREVAGEHAFYFSGLDPEILAGAVRRWLALWRGGLHPRPDDMTWLTWEQSAAQVVEFLFPKRRYLEVGPRQADANSSSDPLNLEPADG